MFQYNSQSIVSYFYSMFHLTKSPASEQMKKKKKNKPFQSHVKLLLNQMQIQLYCSQMLCAAFLRWVLRQGEKCYLYSTMKLYDSEPVRETLPLIQAQPPVAELTGEVPAGDNMTASNLKESEPGG